MWTGLKRADSAVADPRFHFVQAERRQQEEVSKSPEDGTWEGKPRGQLHGPMPPQVFLPLSLVQMRGNSKH